MPPEFKGVKEGVATAEGRRHKVVFTENYLFVSYDRTPICHAPTRICPEPLPALLQIEQVISLAYLKETRGQFRVILCRSLLGYLSLVCHTLLLVPLFRIPPLADFAGSVLQISVQSPSGS